MTASLTLRGMTWDHPRGYDPMLETTRLWRQESGVDIVWEKRSLQDFEDFPVEDLARAYDLVVVDHPHVGQVTAENCLAPFAPGDADAASLGPSLASYHWQGRQWALPIDAAAQVLAYRPDRLPAPPATWAEVVDLARAGRVALPLRPPHSLMAFYTLAAHMGSPCDTNGPPLIEQAAGEAVLGRLRQLAALIDRRWLRADPIAVLEEMARADAGFDCVPLIYGYVPYARAGFRPCRIAFADMPVDAGQIPAGSALGGTGIAVSAFSAHIEAARDYARFVASAAIQSGHYALSGGQPAHPAAWDDEAVNAAAHAFYRATRATLDHAWVRPRHDGYMAFQAHGAQIVNAALAGQGMIGAAIARLNAAYAVSFKGEARPRSDPGRSAGANSP